MIRTFDKLKRIELYTTSANHKLRACDVRKATGADVVINGTLYLPGSWKPVCDVKDNGKVLSNDKYTYRGLAWNNADTEFTVAKTGDMERFDNFISCVFLINEGKALPIDCTLDVGRKAARTAIFKTRDGKTRIWCDKLPLTPQMLAERLLERGDVDWCLMLDGGGSTQLSQEGHDYVYSSRRVQNYICFWEEKEGTLPPFDRSGYEPDIKGYFNDRDGYLKLSEHFRVGEFACRGGADAVLVSPALVMVLENTRQHFGRAMRIHSGYRTPEYNLRPEVGGSPHSQHTLGTAADVSISGVSPEEIAAYVRRIMPNHGGVGIYDTFTHIDVRKQRADWRG